MTRLLTLDIGSCTGWARNLGPNATTYGSQKFSGPLGARALAFEDWLYCAVHESRVEAIAIEAPVPVRENTNLDALLWLRGCDVIARKMCAKEKRRLIVVNVGTWRSFFIGFAHAPKKDPFTGQPLITKHMRRKYLKAATIRECKKQGFDPHDDNAADALGILTYCRACLDPANGMDPNELYAEAA